MFAEKIDNDYGGFEMYCVCCFFDNKHQKLLKEKCFCESSFKEKLLLYKKLYIDELKKLNTLKECDCHYSKKYSNEHTYLQFCDDLLDDYRGKMALIENLFDGLIEVYITYVNKNSSDAYQKLDDYLNKYCTNYSSNNAFQFCDILFRGRPSGKYDIGNIYEYYHIPFSKKNLAGSQRFSIAGKPLLYLARSIPAAAQELDKKFNDINFSVYYPKYSWMYHLSMYNITNSRDITLNNCIYPLILQGSKLEYSNYQFTFSKKNADIIIGDSILFQVLTFPVSIKNKEIEEYILPQMFTNHLEKRGYTGLIYQSTKNINILNKDLKYEMLDYNYCFFVPEDKANDYNEKLLDCFYSVCIGACKVNVTVYDVCNLINDCNVLMKINKEYSFNDYFMLTLKIKTHIDRMEKIVIDNNNYYDIEIGKTEAKLLYGLMEQIKNVIEKPSKYGIIKSLEQNG